MVRPADATLRPQIDRIQRIALIVGAVGLALSVVGLLLNRTQFFQSYLFSFLYWLGPAFGSFGFLMLQNIVGGRWGLMLKRPLEAGALNLVLMAGLFIPLLFGLRDLYVWARPEEVAASELLKHKAPYLNTTGYTVRAVIFFAIWCGFSYLLRTWSLAQDKRADSSLASRMRYLSGPGIVLLFLTMTFAAVDWGMSLEPTWFSSIYGVLYVIGYALETLASMIVLMYLFGDKQPWAAAVNADRIQDIGNLMFGFTILWAYLNFAQYLIIWTGNLPEEITWYLHRTSGGWQYIAVALMFGQFAVPFFLLLLRRNKRRIELLVRIALVVLIMRVVDVFWFITPAFHPEQFSINWLDITTFVGIGGLFVGVFMRTLKRQPLLPANDERLEFATRPAHGH